MNRKELIEKVTSVWGGNGSNALHCPFNSLLGLTLDNVTPMRDQEGLILSAGDMTFVLYHRPEQREYDDHGEPLDDDIREDVRLDDICGDLTDLVGAPIVVADDRVSDRQSDAKRSRLEGCTVLPWTFYHLSTSKGSVVLRFYGSIDGCYAETAQLWLLPEMKAGPL